MSRITLLAALWSLLLAQSAAAWWNPEWSQRRQITLDTSAAGAALAEAVTAVPIAIRLHTGNFQFADAREDGADLRFVAADDKTPLKHHIEKFDSVNELAVVWVQLPRLNPGGKETLWLYYGNDKAARADDPKGTYDAAQTLVLHFGEDQGGPRDATAYGHHPQQSTGRAAATGLLNGAMSFDGDARIELAATEALRVKAGTGLTFSAWLKSADAGQSAVVFIQRDGKQALSLRLAAGRLLARLDAGGAPVEVQGPELAAGAWHHVALTLGERLTLHLDGREVGAQAVKPLDLGGSIAIAGAAGEPGFRGDLDEAQLAAVARSAAWLGLAYAQGPDGKLIAFGDTEAGDAGTSSYFHILIGAVTLDGWVVIAILIVMLFASFAIMIVKAITVARTDSANQRFLAGFQALTADMTALTGKDGTESWAASSLFRLYRLGVQELRHRFELAAKTGSADQLSPQSINAIRASMDAGLVRESHRLNSQMVMLTIAISGGPFLGLLGTVVGVMITFAAIAAVGDVNVNSIAPGIAAALVATVAGLAVAIPALFGYNYLASRIKSITADMQVFADEFIAKVAENYTR